MSRRAGSSLLGRPAVILVAASGLVLTGCGGGSVTAGSDGSREGVGSSVADQSTTDGGVWLSDHPAESLPMSSSSNFGAQAETSTSRESETGEPETGEPETGEPETGERGGSQVVDDEPVGEGPPPAPRFFTLETPAGRYSLTIGASRTLQLPADAPRPLVTGSSIELIDVASVAPGGADQWEVRGQQPGLSTIAVGLDGPRWEVVVTAP